MTPKKYEELKDVTQECWENNKPVPSKYTDTIIDLLDDFETLNYDDDELHDKIDELEDKVSKLEEFEDKYLDAKDEVDELKAQFPNWLNVYVKESMLIGDDIDNLNQLILDYCKQHNISVVQGN